MTRKIIFTQAQSPGDILTFTRPCYDVKKAYPDWLIDVRSPCSELFENNPYTTTLSESDKDIEMYKITYDDIQISGWAGLHFSTAFRNDIVKKLNSRPEMVEKWGTAIVPSTGIVPELFVSDEEKSWYNQIHCECLWDGPFWLLNAGRKPDNALKQYHRWQEVVDILNDYWGGNVKVVQIGHSDHIHPSLKNVFNLVGKTDLRQLIRLAYWADGIMGPISLQFVISAAFDKPSVVVAGGKEGVRWHIYNGIQYIFLNGCMPCCPADGCWLGGAKGQCKQLIDDVPQCFRLIEPKHIADRVICYYAGGRLEVPEKPMLVGNAKVD